MASQKVLVVGAGGATGLEMARALRSQGHGVLATMRTPNIAAESALVEMGAELRRLDILDAKNLARCIGDADAAVFTPILTISSKAARFLQPAQRSVFFSSNNVAIDPADSVYAALLEAERLTLNASPTATILRPTMIYGFPGDGNLSRLAGFFKRLPLAPLPGSGLALQQPIYFKDLAQIAVNALFDPEMTGRICPVSGPDKLSQRALYLAVAKAAQQDVTLVHTPVKLAALMLGMTEKLGLKLPLRAAQLRRAAMDKTPKGENQIVTTTTIEQGLRWMVEAMDSGAT